jgi:DNA primase
MRSEYATLDDALQASGDYRQERPFRCHVHEDHKASASVNVAKGLWTCYTCHAGGRIVGGTSTLNLEDFQQEICALLDERDEPMSESMMQLYTSVSSEYWQSRFTPEAIAKFQLGHDPVTHCPIYPMYDSAGEFLGVVRRQLDRDPKYKYPKGIRAHEHLFNYRPKRLRNVVLVEGAMDAIACWEAGIETFGIYGSHLGQRQVELVAKCAPTAVHLWFDNDAAGANASDQAEKLLLGEYGIPVLRFHWKYHPLAKDVDELPRPALATVAQKMFV